MKAIFKFIFIALFGTILYFEIPIEHLIEIYLPQILSFIILALLQFLRALISLFVETTINRRPAECGGIQSKSSEEPKEYHSEDNLLKNIPSQTQNLMNQSIFVNENINDGRAKIRTEFLQEVGGGAIAGGSGAAFASLVGSGPIGIIGGATAGAALQHIYKSNINNPYSDQNQTNQRIDSLENRLKTLEEQNENEI